MGKRIKMVSQGICGTERPDSGFQNGWIKRNTKV